MNPPRTRKRRRSPLRPPTRRAPPPRTPSRRASAPPRPAAERASAPHPAGGAGPGHGPLPRRAHREERLQKLLAAAGLGSRRRIEAWIAAGRVTVGGRPARLGDRASPADAIALDGTPVRLAGASGALPRVIAYHKPAGELVTRDDPMGRSTVFEQLPPLRGGRWVGVGRLDMNTSGLLLLTDSGELANRLMHPRHALAREYAVRVRGVIDPEQRRRLLTGVRLADGIARFEQLQPMRALAVGGANRWYRVGLREGRNREVRRLFEAVGLQVSRLIRVRFGPLTLARDLRPGRWRELSRTEVLALLG